MEKKLYRSKKDRMLCGVCGGMAKYLNMDPTVVRVLWALLSIFVGAGIIAYLVCAFIIPEDPENNEK